VLIWRWVKESFKNYVFILKKHTFLNAKKHWLQRTFTSSVYYALFIFSGKSGHLNFLFFILFICAYNVWVISHPFPPPPPLHPPFPPLPPLNPCYLAEIILPLSLIMLYDNVCVDHHQGSHVYGSCPISHRPSRYHQTWNHTLF
jgi:hypothetical protein